MSLEPTAQLEFLPEASAATALAALPAPLSAWFRYRFGELTGAQRLAWPALAAGKNLLLSSPTGSGKSLAAFLPLLGEIVAAPFHSGIRCLYVAPLKVLANDVCRNLQANLGEIAAFLPEGTPLPRLAVRTGDTSAEERRRLRDDPPDVLLTTPESLAVLLSQSALTSLFSGLRWIIVDEIHALAPTKRGADLALSLERLAALTHETLQRIGLSATATPLDVVAQFLVGVGRSCAIGHVPDEPELRLTLAPLPESGSFLKELVNRLLTELAANRSTLVFTNARGLAERLAWALRRQRPDWDGAIAVHHSSLAAERRRDVEGRFKRGELRAVISSTSLELGIDVGSVDQVVLVHPPGDVVRLLQRVGRSGHGPGQVRRGLVLTANAAELLEATVTTASGRDGQCEPLRLPVHPLDVLCQQLLGMAACRWWLPEEALALVRRAFPFRDLTAADFDDCLNYLSGKGRDGSAWLPARLRWEDGLFTIRDRQTARLLRQNVGFILAEEPAPVVLQPGSGVVSSEDFGEPTPQPVGSVDQAFAERLQPGDRFLLDGRCLEFRRREGESVVVDEVAGRPAVPRWNGEGWPLSAELARRLYRLRVRAAETLRDGREALTGMFRREYGLEGEAAQALVTLFERQECVSEVPDEATCLVEAVATEAGFDYYVHTPLNRLANDALARVVLFRLAREESRPGRSLVADLGFALQGCGGFADLPVTIRKLLTPERFEEDLEAALAGSVSVRIRFQRVAQTGLMTLRNPLGRRRRVGGRSWGERRLYEQVAVTDPEFVLVRQAEREVREEVCDASTALAFVRQLPVMTVRCRWLGQPSPFVESWTQAGLGVAEVVESPAETLQRLHAQLTGRGESEENGCTSSTTGY
jgi:ATP-dependent Lhr-like helicase